jgi:hypothetical protein
MNIRDIPLFSAQVATAQQLLSEPPRLPFVDRPEFRGERVVAFALPLRLCHSTNETSTRRFQSQYWKIKKEKDELAALMRFQCHPFKKPLGGRPQVLAVRFGYLCPDKYANWAKWAIDVLRAGRPGERRLNIIRDDSPECIEEHQWWEPLHKGFVYLEVRA